MAFGFSADQAAAGVVHVLREGSHGSIWAVEGGDTAELTIPIYTIDK